jgi:uncharacterized protein YjiS (DUF1127 family)
MNIAEASVQINAFVLFRSAAKLSSVGPRHPRLPTEQEPSMATPNIERGISLTLPARTHIAASLRAFLRQVLQAQRTLASRRLLHEMEPRMLADIGITHAEAIEEARRAPWDLTARPRRR